jgi:hypothetical protein
MPRGERPCYLVAETNFEREKIVCVEQGHDLFISFLELGYRKFRNTPVIESQGHFPYLRERL